jgi:glycosyltransferase involved in cell wall biosynthesis
MNQNNSKKRKIIYLITGSDTGGAEIVVKNLIFNLNQDKFLPVFVSIRPLGIIGREISERFKAISLGAGEKFNPFFLLRFFILLKKERPDILHCHLFHANFVGRIIGRMAGVKFIISTIHSDNFGNKLRYLLLKMTDFLNDLTVVVSQKIKDDLIKKGIVPDKKIMVIYNGVKEAENNISSEDIYKIKKDLSIENNSPIILSIGRLHEVKGHIYLIRAIKILTEKNPDLRLLIIGDGPERKNLENESVKLGLSHVILFLGEIRETVPYYKLADIFVLPSINEGFGLSIVEAMSNKLLVVASNVGGVPEIIKDGANGFLVNPGDPIKLAEVISKIILKDKLDKEKIIENAYNNFKSNFSLETMLDKYTLLYN